MDGAQGPFSDFEGSNDQLQFQIPPENLHPGEREHPPVLGVCESHDPSTTLVLRDGVFFCKRFYQRPLEA